MEGIVKYNNDNSVSCYASVLMLQVPAPLCECVSHISRDGDIMIHQKDLAHSAGGVAEEVGGGEGGG